MRILSQETLAIDDVYDIPYEITMLSITRCASGVYGIYAQGAFIGNAPDDNFVCIAEYKTEEKAKKAMKMLREAYSQKSILIEEPKEMPKLNNGDWVWTVTEPKVEVLDNFYFQFPADDEVKV